VKLFKHIELGQLNNIAGMMVVEHFDKGQTIIHSGKKPAEMFVVISGKKNHFFKNI